MPAMGGHTTSDLSCFQFSSENLPQEHWLPLWQELCGRSVARRILSPLGDSSWHRVEMTVRKLGSTAGPGVSLAVTRMKLATGGAARRTPELLSDGDDDVILSIQERGHRIVTQLGREAALSSGSGILTSNADASVMVCPEATQLVSISLPRNTMGALVPALEDAFVRPLPETTGALNVLLRYLDIFEDDALGTPAVRLAVATHVHDLCALAIGASRDAAEVAKGRGLRAARLHAVKADIARHLADPELSATVLATHQGVTPRYIHKLFETDGTTLSRFVLGHRLVKVHRMLHDAHYAGLTIGAIAYRGGFSDLSTFNREFRRRFGATPSDVRAAARCAARDPCSS